MSTVKIIKSTLSVTSEFIEYNQNLRTRFRWRFFDMLILGFPHLSNVVELKL